MRGPIKPSGHSPTHLGPGRTAYISSWTGHAFETRQMLAIHNRTYINRVRRDFETLVREKGLGCQPWERLPGETPLNYRRFQSYLNLQGRNYVKVAAIHSIERRVVERWASGWHWKFRADLWDRHLEAEELKEYEYAKRQSARKQARLGQRLQQVAMEGANAILNDPERIEGLSGNELAKLADVGTKIERLANSDPTSISDDRGHVRLVWDGPAPSWAPPEPIELDHHPLTQKVIEGQR